MVLTGVRETYPFLLKINPQDLNYLLDRTVLIKEILKEKKGSREKRSRDNILS